VFSIVIGFGVATLLATGFLMVVQIVDDFRGA
jgi:putative copper export protein